jgi:hypothetical protein
LQGALAAGDIIVEADAWITKMPGSVSASPSDRPLIKLRAGRIGWT